MCAESLKVATPQEAVPIALPLHRTKSDLVYQSLKEAILSGSLRPGDRLKVKALSEQLKVSQTPVREALRLLTHEGLVVITPHSDVRVADLPMEGIEENLLIRAELEALATRVAAQHVTDAILSDLEGVMSELDECVRKADGQRYGELNRRFHLTLYQIIPYRGLYALVEELWNQVPRARSVFVLIPQYMERSQEEHRLILQALRHRDGEAAARIVREQKLAAREALVVLRRRSSSAASHPGRVV